MPLFESSFADVGLPVATAEASGLVERMICAGDLRDLQPPAGWPGKNLAGIAWADPVKGSPVRLGSLFWPSGATRWAVGRFLASHYHVNQILGQVEPSAGSPPVPKTLKLQCESDGIVGSVSAKMYLLPPRPLAGLLQAPLAAFVGTPVETVPGDLYLLTLVDVRYFWQFSRASSGVGTTGTPEAWSDLISTTLSDALNAVTLTPGTIDPKYGSVEPDSAFWASAENAAVMLDGALANTGRVLAANYDGTFTVQKIADANTAVKTERAKWADRRHAGGPILKLDTSVSDVLRNLILPEKVAVTFPQWVDDVGYYEPSPQYRGWNKVSYGAVKVYEVTTSTLAGFSGVQPMTGWTKVFHDTAKARYASSPPSGSPSNDTTLNDLATQIAQDYCDGLKSRLDEVYPGVVPWTPDGVNDLLFVYATETCTTRVQGPPLNGGVSELQHSLGPLEVPASAATGFEIVRIQGQFVKDDGSQTACGGGPSPLCYYPGAPQKMTCAGWADDASKPLVWVVFWYTYADVNNGTSPPTVVIVDGNAATDARPMGFSYAPTDVASELEYNGDSRPVYGSTGYARGRRIGCDPVTGQDNIVLGGS